ncbi:MAG: GNAT family N-acetyltransferase [Holophagaceae bacterium]
MNRLNNDQLRIIRPVGPRAVGYGCNTVPSEGPKEDYDYIPGLENNNYYGVTYIFVTPKLRGQGIAQELMEHALVIVS